MRLQPLRGRGGRALGQQIHHVMALEITHDGPEASASPPGPFVEPNHPWRRQRRAGRTMDQTQNRPAAPREAQGVREPCAGTTANGDAHVP
jgi:hypothetical protein